MIKYNLTQEDVLPEGTNNQDGFEQEKKEKLESCSTCGRVGRGGSYPFTTLPGVCDDCV